MERNLYKKLLDWKEEEDRMPLVLMGCRQVGKTWLFLQFGKKEYPAIHVFNFQENPGLQRIFQKDLNTARIIEELSIIQRKDINTKTDLVFFDEIQECDAAVTSLKYFYENRSELHIVAAGSLLGVKLNFSSFPVGKVEMFHLYPMNFEEFLKASSNEMALRLYLERNRLETAHTLLWELLCQYFFVGGMPKAVERWFSGEGVNKRIETVRKTQKDILSGYEKDFAKHSGKINALDITTLFKSVPQQLFLVLDGSVKRFRFKEVLPNKRTYAHLSNSISWLENAGLLYKVFPIEGKPHLPLKAFTKDNLFKLFVFDVGMLGAMLDLSYSSLVQQDYGIAKGFFAENFVACELKAQGNDSLFSWFESKSEIEFLYVYDGSEIIPLEVKSGKRTRAKSLTGFMDRHSPNRTIKLVGAVGGTNPKNIVLPLYYAGELGKFLKK